MVLYDSNIVAFFMLQNIRTSPSYIGTSIAVIVGGGMSLVLPNLTIEFLLSGVSTQALIPVAFDHYRDAFSMIYLIFAHSRLAMSSDNASSVVTYTSISSNSNRPLWGIPLVNAGELPEMDPYEEDDSIDYPDEPEDDEEDPEEDLKEDHTDYPTDGEDGDDEPSDDDDNDNDTDDKDEEPTEDEERRST
ncbi:hypothetical protein Tco_0834941 [Tanacetum coccineum]